MRFPVVIVYLAVLQFCLASTPSELACTDSFCGQTGGSCSASSTLKNQFCERTPVPYLVANFGSYYLDCSLPNKLVMYREQNCISPLYASNQSVCVYAPLYKIDALISCSGNVSSINIFTGLTACLGAPQTDHGYFFTQNKCSALQPR